VSWPRPTATRQRSWHAQRAARASASQRARLRSPVGQVETPVMRRVCRSAAAKLRLHHVYRFERVCNSLTQEVVRYPGAGPDGRPDVGRTAAADPGTSRHATMAEDAMAEIVRASRSATTTPRPRRAGPTPLKKRELGPTERTCTDCGTTKPLTAEFFLPITRGGFTAVVECVGLNAHGSGITRLRRSGPQRSRDRK